jgi:hypothetical protein
MKHELLKVNFPPFLGGVRPYLNKLESPSPKDNLYQVRLILEKILTNLLFRYYLPLEKGYLLPLNELESPSPKDDLCQVWLKLVQ